MEVLKTFEKKTNSIGTLLEKKRNKRNKNNEAFCFVLVGKII